MKIVEMTRNIMNGACVLAKTGQQGILLDESRGMVAFEHAKFGLIKVERGEYRVVREVELKDNSE